MITTDNSLDLAIEGTGFFQVLLPDGRIGYTRNGSFSTNAEGTLTTASGYVVQPKFKFQLVHQINISRTVSLAFCSRELTTLRQLANLRLLILQIVLVYNLLVKVFCPHRHKW